MYSEDIAHDVHVALSPSGTVVSRWRMVAEEVPDCEPNTGLLKR